MATLIEKADFVGEYAISSDAKTNSILDSLIDEIEIRTMYELLGKTLADAFLADADANGGVPTDPNYLIIYNRLMLDVHQMHCYCNADSYYSFGIKEMLKAFVYVQFNIRIAQVSTTVGLRNVQASVSNSAKLDGKYITNVQNKGVEAFRTIQNYIYDNQSDFPDFEGVRKNYAFPF